MHIQRVWGTTFDKDKKLLRVINMMTIGLGLFFQTLIRIRKGDDVFVGTNPPTLPFLVSIACWLRGAKCHLKVEDVYPDNMVVAGGLRPNALLTRLLEKLERGLYRRVDSICVLGRDMENLVKAKCAPLQTKTHFIPNWADVEEIQLIPRQENRLIAELGLAGKFIVGYSGNIGPLQDIRHIFDCIVAMKVYPSVHFLIIGSGRMSEWLKNSIIKYELTNVTLLGPRPRADQSTFLGACDLGIVSLSAGMAGLGVPSRTYNRMAAGSPLLASVDPESEVALIVQEEGIGWVCRPGDVDGFCRAILEAESNPGLLQQMSVRSRRIAEGKYSASTVLDQYIRVLDSVG